jgi:site-specific DNA-cytosine methylase
MVIEWAVLDAQYFGVPQRRRRVFVIAIFDPVLAERCPSPLLPVAESLPRHLTKSKPKRQSTATKTTKSIGTDGAWWDGRDTAEALTTTSNEQRMPDKQRFQAIVEQEVVGTLTVSDLVKQVNNEIIGKGLLQVVEDRQPYTPSSFAQYKEEDLNAVATLRAGGGDLGGGSEVLIAEPVAYHFDALSSNSMKSSNPESGVNKVDQARTLDTWRPDPSLNQGGLAIVEELMLIDGTRVDDVRIYEEPVQTLKERMGTGGNNVPMLAFDTQFGSNANVTENVAPTLKSSQAPPSVAYPIHDQATRHSGKRGDKKDGKGNGFGIGNIGDPMNTLTSGDRHAVAQEEPTVFQPGTMVRLNGGVWEGTVPTLRAESKRGDNEPHIQIHNAEPTMAVRRLTPLECERLMGWPDDHTRYKADGTEQADTHRYKQCGNGVASPVAQWIAKHLLNIQEQP